MKQYFETQRLIFRSWQEEDISYLARLNSDDKVMEYFLKKLSYQETIALYNQIQEEFTAYGFGKRLELLLALSDCTMLHLKWILLRLLKSYGGCYPSFGAKGMLRKLLLLV